MFLCDNWAEMTVGERLISYRKEYEKEYNQKLKQSDPSSPNVKISQDTVSESVGIDRSTLSRIESGKQEIRLEEILKLADYYGVSCDEMIRGSKPEYAKISATTGLSGKSIQWFRDATKEQKIMVDTIFRNREIANALVEIFNIYTNLHIPTVIKNEDGTITDRVSAFLASEEKLLNAALTEHIQKLLMNIRESKPISTVRLKNDEKAVQEALERIHFRYEEQLRKEAHNRKEQEEDNKTDREDNKLSDLRDGIKRLTIVAGVSGSGKSSMIGVLQVLNGFDEEIIDIDQIASTEKVDSVQATKLAIKKINSFLESGKDFIIETTLSDAEYHLFVKKARNIGYKVIVYYIGLDSLEECLKRVENKKNHGIQLMRNEDISTSYADQALLLWKLAEYTDLICFFDNQNGFRLVANYNPHTERFACDDIISSQCMWIKELKRSFERRIRQHYNLTQE